MFAENGAAYRQLLSRFEQLGSFARTIPTDGEHPTRPHWANDWVPALDALSLCGLILEHRPARYIEVGSGTSTKFARAVIDFFGLKTAIVSIDPHPRAEINALCDDTIRAPLEDVSEGFFEALSASDMVFMDNSHRSFQNSDATVFFTEILPSLPTGTIYGVHDIFLPYDYPAIFLDRFYSEQYLLAAYLFGGHGGDELVLPCHSASREASLGAPIAALASACGIPVNLMAGGCFWARRAAN